MASPIESGSYVYDINAGITEQWFNALAFKQANLDKILKENPEEHLNEELKNAYLSLANHFLNAPFFSHTPDKSAGFSEPEILDLVSNYLKEINNLGFDFEKSIITKDQSIDFVNRYKSVLEKIKNS